VIAAALRFDSAEDPGAQELQQRIEGEGIERVLHDLCGIRADEPAGKRVLEVYMRRSWELRA